MRTISVPGCAIVLLLLPAAYGSAQVRDQTKPPARDNPTSPTGSASLSGTVVTDSEPARPVRRAIVTANSADRTVARTIVTDDNGRFILTGLPAGRYAVDASKRGWATVSYGSKGPGRPGTTIPLADGQRATATIRLPRAGVISGTILDEKGQPLSAVNIRVMHYAFTNGERRLGWVNSMTSGPDERGQYRVYGLAPGDYYIIASTGSVGPFRQSSDLHLTSDVDVEQAAQSVRDGPAVPVVDVPQRSVNFAPVYYPGVFSAAQAGQITLHAGEERTGVDFAISYVAAVRIEGTVAGIDGAPAATSVITLVNSDPNATGLGFDSVRTARADASGHYSFGSVTPGSYVLSARTATPAAWAQTDVDVQGEDVRNVTLALQEAFNISGTVRFEGAATAPPPANVRVTLQPQVSSNAIVVSSGLGVNAEADGRFTIKGVSPGRYRLNAFVQGPRPPWTMESANLGGQDALDTFVDVRKGVTDGAVVFTDKVSELSGHAAPDSTVILFSANQALWYPQSRRLLSVRAGGDGSYIFRNAPPGDYFLTAVDDVEPGQWSDPAYLQSLMPSAMKVTIGEGEKKTLDVRAGGS